MKLLTLLLFLDSGVSKPPAIPVIPEEPGNYRNTETTGMVCYDHGGVYVCKKVLAESTKTK